ncbi:alpha-amylase [Lachnospiraceae bacterium RM5]|nr:alpha-amylase [Lachnospiraceae bacterium RM5]
MINKKIRQMLCAILSLAMFVSMINITPYVAKAETDEVTESTSTNSYGLRDNVGEGVILHAWNWSFTNIKNNMADIAAAGYTAVQTSPVQRPKEYSRSSSQTGWWKVYQPTSLSFSPGGHPWFGTKDDFKAMCDEADKYGIKIIVDVVANHMANNDGKKGNCREDISSQNDSTYRDDDSCWHLNGSTHIDYKEENLYRGNSQTSLTRGFGGWPDLNTANSKVQQGVLDLLKECIDLGADGFRFDAAKHIELPTDPDGSNFWPTVINGANSYASSKGVTLYNYGEILDNPGTAISNYTKYMAVTDNRAGNNVRDAVKDGNAKNASSSYTYYSGQSAKNIVLWAESHDTYANDDFTGPSHGVSQSNVNKTWAIVASRNFPALYYIRPSDTSSNMGTASKNTSWKNKEIVEVNKFHNFYSGKSEYLGYDGSIVYDVRNKNGVVLVNVNGNEKSVNFSISATGMADGKYIDQVTGNEFNVSGGKISGKIGSTGIAVVYNPVVVKDPSVSVSREGGKFSTESVDVTLKLVNATSGTYKIGTEAEKTFTTDTVVNIGSSLKIGESIVLKVTATDGTKNYEKQYTFTKIEKANNVAYIDAPSSWGSTIYCYVYDKNVSGLKNAKFPGVQMTYDEEAGAYKYEIPEEITSPRVIFYSSDSHRYPLAEEPGLDIEGEMIYRDGTWGPYEKLELPDLPVVAEGYKRVFFKNTAGWSKVKAYNWGSAGKAKEWPGTTMTEYDKVHKIYYIDVNEAGGYTKIIFNDGNGTQTGDLKVPSDEKNMYTYSSSSWSVYTPPVTNGKVLVTYKDTKGNTIIDSKTLTGKIGDAYEVNAPIIEGYKFVSVTGNEKGTYTKEDITVSYVYEENAVEELKAPLVWVRAKSNTTAVLTWDAVEGATGYQLYKYYASSGQIVKSKLVTDTTATFYNLKKGSTYRYIVQPVSDTAVCSNVSKEYAVDVKMNAGKVTLSSVSYANNAVTLKWNKVDGVNTYYVYKYYQSSKTLSSPKEVKTNSCKYNNIEGGKACRYLISTEKLTKLNNYSGDGVISILTPAK